MRRRRSGGRRRQARSARAAGTGHPHPRVTTLWIGPSARPSTSRVEDDLEPAGPARRAPVGPATLWRQGIAKALADYTSFYKKGCTPPDAATWDDTGNNKAFHDQKVVMTINTTLSIPSALRAKRPDDYFKNTTSIEWPLGPDGKRYPLDRGVQQAVVFKDAKHVDAAKEFLRFLVQGGEVGSYLEASQGRYFPATPALLKTPFWQDPADPHRRMAAKLLGEWPAEPSYVYVDPRHAKVDDEKVWEKAVHNVAVKGVAPEQAADEAIARIKQLLGK